MNEERIRDGCDKIVNDSRSFDTAVQVIFAEYIQSPRFAQPEMQKYRPLLDILFLDWDVIREVHDAFMADIRDLSYDESTSPVEAALQFARCFIVHEKQGNFDVYLHYFANIPRAMDILDKLRRSHQPFTAAMVATERSAQERSRAHNINTVDSIEDVLRLPMAHMRNYASGLIQIRMSSAKSEAEDMCKRAHELINDISKSARVIIEEDTPDLVFLENLQNSILDLPLCFGKESWNKFKKSRMKRTNLRDNGKYLQSGDMDVRGLHLDKFTPRMVVLFDRMVLFLRESGKEDKRGPLYNVDRTFCDREMDICEIERNPLCDNCITITLGNTSLKVTFFCRVQTDTLVTRWIRAGNMRDPLEDMKPSANYRKHFMCLYQFMEPTKCAACNRLLQGIHYQGYRCLSLSDNITPVEKTFVKRPTMGSAYNPACHKSFHRQCAPEAEECARNMAGAPELPASATRRLNPWDAADMPRDTAEMLLKQCRYGAFLIRTEGEDKWLSMSYIEGKWKFKIAVVHIRIGVHNGEYYLTEQELAEAPTFANLTALTEHYNLNQGGIIAKHKDYLGDPYRDALLKEKRKRGGFYFDWVHPPIADEVLISFKLIDMRPLDI